MNIELAITRSYLTALSKLPKSIQKKANDFFVKFKENPDSSAINYEKIHTMKDDKVRTVRIDQKYRAIVLHPPEGNMYLFVHIDNHDEAMDWAKNKVFDVNQYSSALQLIDMEIESNNEALKRRNEYSSTESTKTILDTYSENELISIGIPKMVLPSLKLVTTNSDLTTYIKNYVSPDIYEILEFCLEGLAIDEIKECFSIEQINGNITFTEAIGREVNKSYIRVVSDEKDINAVLDNPIDFWRIFIHPNQRRYVEGDYKGSFQIKGSAGTGKTVVAMHRAKHLVENIYTADDDRILYTTFSKKLTKSVEYNLKNMCDLNVLKKIEVINLHSWIAKYLRKNNISFQIVDDKTRIQLVKDALKKTGFEGSYSISDIVLEIDIVLLPNQITKLEKYLKVSRNGAYKKLGRNQRKEVWSVISEYFEMLYEMDLKEWWMIIKDLIAMIQRKNQHHYRAIIIDEAQDFGMPEYRLLRNLIPEKENDLFIVGDIRQKIYSTTINFKKCGINILGNRTRELKTNYRNTFEIGQLAERVISDIEFKDLDDTTIKDMRAKAVIRGDKPIIKKFDDASGEVEYIANEIEIALNAGIKHEEIAIIARKNDYIRQTTDRLLDFGIKTLNLEDLNSLSHDHVYCGTMHSIKGFEFKIVFLVGISSEIVPLRTHLDKLEFDRQKEEFLKLEKSLLYVAITRARDCVYILGSPDVCEWVC